MAHRRRGWTVLAAGLALVLLVAWVGCDRREGADDGTPQGGGAATTEPDGAAGAAGAEGADVGGDAAITVRVKTALAADPRVSALMIDVDTQNGIVTLKGDVESEEAKSAAEEVTRGAEGVMDVVNMVTAGTPGGDGGSSAAGQDTEP